MKKIEELKKFIEEFENEGDDEWSLDVEDVSHFIYWASNNGVFITINTFNGFDGKDPIYFLLKNKVLVSREINKSFQLNLTRDGHKKSIKDIILAMEEYAFFKNEKERH